MEMLLLSIFLFWMATASNIQIGMNEELGEGTIAGASVTAPLAFIIG